MQTLLLVLLLSLLSAPAFASDGVLEINQTCAVQTGCFPGDAPGYPITIAAGGSYRLTSNLLYLGTGTDTIQLQASLITLDLGGFSIQGPSSCSFSGSGVLCSGAGAGGSVSTINGRTSCPFGNTVRNGTILNAAGNAVELCASSRVVDVTIIGANADGIFVNEGSIVERCNVVLAGTIGIWAPSSSVFDSVVRDSGRAGDSFISGISGFSGVAVAVRGNQLFRLYQGGVSNEYFENQRSLGPNSCDGNAC
jgi:hypothetical protein